MGQRTTFLDVITYTILTGACLFALFPILWGLNTSLKPGSMVLSRPPQWIPRQITLENYRLALLESSVPRSLLNSVIVTVSAVILTMLLAVPAGYISARAQFRGRHLILLYILATSMIPGIAVLLPLYVIAVRLGMSNRFITIILVYAGWQTPTAVWVTKGFFQTVSREIEDAARVDGCSRLGILVRIMLPIVQPGLAATAVISFVYIWNDFLIASTFITAPELRLINVGLYQYLSQYGIMWGQLMAAVIVTLVPVVLMFSLLETRFIQGLSMGATKG